MVLCFVGLVSKGREFFCWILSSLAYSGWFLHIAYSSFKCAEYNLFLSSVCPAVCPAESVCLDGICQCFAGSFMVNGMCEKGKGQDKSFLRD